MKKRTLKKLELNKVSIDNLSILKSNTDKIKGGAEPASCVDKLTCEEPYCPKTLIKNCQPDSCIDTDCTFDGISG